VVVKKRTRYFRAVVMAMMASAALVVGGCKSGEDSAFSPGEKAKTTSSNTRSFDEWTVSPGHPWSRMSAERKEEKEQKKLEKQMQKDEEAFRKDFPKTWNQ
jgi:hypothetical protein